MTRCPECESDLELDGYELDVGENINCPECSTELKVTAGGSALVTFSSIEHSGQLMVSPTSSS